MVNDRRALILGYADCASYLVAYTRQPPGASSPLELVHGQGGQPLKFPSLCRAKQWWLEAGESHAWLVLSTPYDEMIGKESLGSDELPLVL